VVINNYSDIAPLVLSYSVDLPHCH